MPSRVAALPVIRCPVGSGPSADERRTHAGRPGATGATCRSGSGRRTASSGWSPRRRRSIAGVRIMQRAAAAGRRRAGDAVGAGNSGSSAVERHEDRAAPPLLTRSRPWSKNWPNSVNHELYGADRPTSVATLGMKQPFPSSSAGGVGTGRGHGRRRVRWGLVHDQVADPARLGVHAPAVPGSRRRVVRNRLELCWDVHAGRPGRPRRTSSGPRRVASSNRLLHEPSTVRRPHGSVTPTPLSGI